MNRSALLSLVAALAVSSCVFAQGPAARAPAIAGADLSAWRAESGSSVRADAGWLQVSWPISATERGELVFNLTDGRPLLERIAVSALSADVDTSTPLMKQVDPTTLLTIGERDMSAPSGWMTFFDHPSHRPYKRVLATLKKTRAVVSSAGNRTTVRIGDVTADSFHGALEFTVSVHSPLVQVATVVRTEVDGRAILYDAGLITTNPDWPSLAWRDTHGALQHTKVDPHRAVQPMNVGGRTVVAETRGGSLAVFPAPHQYFYPLDFADNLGFAWQGASSNALGHGYGFGIRQPPEGDRRYAPWINAPPGTDQRLSVFLLLSSAPAEPTLDAVASFTRGDHYKPLPGYHTFTSHYHIEHTLEFAKAQHDQNTTGVPAGLETPGFVTAFKARGVDIVHLAEFHVGPTPRLPAPERLAQLKILYSECARLSDRELLVLPGEEPNVDLGGHWLSFFPKPVYWVLHRARNEPFEEQVPGYGTVYRVGSPDDVLQLMERERGLMWTAHARIKSSRGFPDAYWDKPFFRSDRFLGAAWKAMPSDLSLPRLGPRVLDLMDDMANAGMKKFVIAEADLFRIEPDYETYGHMNINYVQLAEVPRFADGWQPVLDALRAGKSFATTGEVLIPRWSLAGKSSGETVTPKGKEPLPLEVALEWTFPLAFAEVISGDGKQVYRQRIDLSDTEPFGERVLRLPVDLANRTWMRFEVWDMACNGAFTEPIYLR